MSKATALRPGFSAIVRTTEQIIVATALGNVQQPEEVLVKAGGDLPANLASGEYDRLDALGAFEPLPPRPVSGVFDPVTGQQALGALPGDTERTAPGPVRIPTDAETKAAAALAAAQADVRRVFDDTQREGLATEAPTLPPAAPVTTTAATTERSSPKPKPAKRASKKAG